MGLQRSSLFGAALWHRMRPSSISYKTSSILTKSYKTPVLYRNYCTRYTPNWKTQYTAVLTNVDRFDNWQRGVDFKVGYIDSAHHLPRKEKAKLPVIIGVHDCPGSHRDIHSLLEPYAEQGYRVVLPNLPSFGETTFLDGSPQEHFQHSTVEQAEFLLQFLSVIHVTETSLLVGHGVGTLPLTVIASKSPTGTIKGAVFVCPVPGDKPRKGVYMLLHAIGNWWYAGKIKRLLLTLIVKRRITAILNKTTNTTNSAEAFAALIQTAHNTGYDFLPGIALEMTMKRVPLLYVIAEGDDSIRGKDSLNYAQKFDLDQAKFDKYDSDMNLINKAVVSPLRYSKGIRFEGADHNLQMIPQYREIIQREIDLMLDNDEEKQENKAKQ